MINDRWLIAIAKCRQIARQMRPSRGIDAIVDVLQGTNGFDRSNDGVLNCKTSTCKNDLYETMSSGVCSGATS
jgi:hypothetical protein